MSVYVFNIRKNICCKNVIEMGFGGKISKNNFLIKILGSALFSRVGRETGNTKFIPYSLIGTIFVDPTLENPTL